MSTLLPQSSIQIAIEEVPQRLLRASISHVTCINQSERTMVRICQALPLGSERGMILKVPFSPRVLNLKSMNALGIRGLTSGGLRIPLKLHAK